MSGELHGHEGQNTFGESVISLLSSITVGAFAWGILWGLVFIVKWAGPEFGLEFLTWAAGGPVDIALQWTPPFLGLIVGIINYGKVLELEA